MLDGIGGKLVQRGAEVEDRIRLKLDVRTVERRPIEIGAEHDVEKLHDRDRFPAALRDQPVRIRHGEHARLILAGEIRDAFRGPGGLREQRQQLGKQVAGTVPHVADHQFVALLELAALNGAGEKIADGGKERSVLRAEGPHPGRRHAKDAVGAAVATGDGRMHAADAVVFLEIMRNLEPVFGGEIGDDDRRGRIQRDAGVGVGLRRRQCRPDEVGLPAEAGAQYQLGAAGKKLEDLDEFDRQRQRDGADRIVEQPFEIGLGQRALAELSQRLLLLGAAAQLVLEIDPLGDVVAQADHALCGAVRGDDRSGRLEPALVAAFARRRAIARAIRPSGCAAPP